MPDTPQSLATRLREEGSRVIDFFNRLSKDQRATRVYPDEGDWSLHHLLAHFVSAEIGRKKLICSVARGDEGAPVGFEIDAFNQREVERLSGEPFERLVEIFSQERANLTDIVTLLKQEDLERLGNDPYLGTAPLQEMIKLTYRHLQIHLRDARKCL